jgi:ADP-heptose:LPS heptosyltransferase
MNHTWPQEVREKYMDTNYLEFTADLAGVPYSNRLKFYPTPEEEVSAKARLCDGLNVVWALSGSSQHKFYPGQDAVIANILRDHKDCRIFMVGDEACRLLQMGWEKEKRVVMLSGEMGIRDTLALAKVADVVVGCETGVLNAVAFEDNRKVVLLSHSSHENLTKHWTNTFAMVPPATLKCYPCHRLHHTMHFCQEDAETGAAMCQRLIDPLDVYGAITFKDAS